MKSKSESSKPKLKPSGLDNNPQTGDLSIKDLIEKETNNNNNIHNSGYNNVIKKLKDYTKDCPKDEEYINNKFGGIENFAEILSDKEKFKQFFFWKLQ